MKILLKKHFGWFYEKLNNDAIDSYAAQVSFWILISFIPFLMLILALLQVIRFEDTSLLVAFVQMLPPPVEEVVSYLFQEVHAPQTLISMTAITCVWSASTAMVALIKGLYSVFDVSKNHNYIFMRIFQALRAQGSWDMPQRSGRSGYNRSALTDVLLPHRTRVTRYSALRPAARRLSRRRPSSGRP